MTNFQVVGLKAPTPAVMSLTYGPIWGATPTNEVNLYAADRLPPSAIEKPTGFRVSQKYVGEKEGKAYLLSICLDLKPPYASEVATKPYPWSKLLHSPEI